MTAVELQGAFNVRDLGGLRTRDGRRTRYGLIYRGDSLDSITPGDAKILFDKLGIGTIVDLRTQAETELGDREFPVPRYRFSVLAEGRLGREPFPSDDPAELAKVYLNNLEGGRSAVKNTFEIIAANLQAGVPTLFHCAAGRDRTGIITILGFMRQLQEAGGPRQFCLDSGVSEETISVIESRFVGGPDEVDGR